jgi:hypothetical protein
MGNPQQDCPDRHVEGEPAMSDILADDVLANPISFDDRARKLRLQEVDKAVDAEVDRRSKGIKLSKIDVASDIALRVAYAVALLSLAAMALSLFLNW